MFINDWTLLSAAKTQLWCGQVGDVLTFITSSESDKVSDIGDILPYFNRNDNASSDKTIQLGNILNAQWQLGISIKKTICFYYPRS